MLDLKLQTTSDQTLFHKSDKQCIELLKSDALVLLVVGGGSGRWWCVVISGPVKGPHLRSIYRSKEIGPVKGRRNGPIN